MKLWLLTRTTGRTIYDGNNRLVVRAKDENDARALAAHYAGDEGMKTWTNAESSTCTQLTARGIREVIVIDSTSG